MINKSYFMLLIFFVFGILLVGTVSAAKINYEDNDMKVNFKKSFLGISTGDLGSIELKSHTSVDEVKVVEIGNQIVMWYDFNWIELNKDMLEDVEFIDMRTGEGVERDYEFVYWQEEVCNKQKHENKSEYDGCVRGKWLHYNIRDIPEGKTTIGIKVNVNRRDYIDGIWNIAGEKVSRHAEWTELGNESNTGEGATATTTNLTSTFTAISNFGYISAIGLQAGTGSSDSIYQIHVNQSGSNLSHKTVVVPSSQVFVYLNFTSDDYSEALFAGRFTIDYHMTTGDSEIGFSSD